MQRSICAGDFRKERGVRNIEEDMKEAKQFIRMIFPEEDPDG